MPEVKQTQQLIHKWASLAVQAIRALSTNENPDAKRVAMQVYLQLSEAWLVAVEHRLGS